MADLVLPTADGDMPAYEAAPADPRGAVVVLQEAFGLNGHIKAVCDRIAAAGYLAVAPALFHRQGNPVAGYDDFAALMPVFESMDLEGIRTDVHATYGYLEGKGYANDRTAMTGFCMGGSITLWAATERPLAAAVTWYGGGVREGRFVPAGLELASELVTPWLGLYGDLDWGIPVDDVEALRAEAAKAAVPTEVVRFADAGHGFNCDERASYHAEAAAAGWQRMLDWFAAHLG